ncbi:SusC/RagA family TonB-linked outer membrane protein [Pedobacter sp. HMWF019]|uniref:SusC/RagA family TonB-linked outer membrane protein n=1 Tax=Pedobacter sp. HMWF019 TaxID=2056856 RepID=UPI000D37062B|nr:SusC/RagA family TonB-linked outer membrane protein [Pedobacter sp. HMWF019]PTT03576.1 SusC/RagA family TonB-linked outer membrane protein [Pedobacter sp. HMWF019]
MRILTSIIFTLLLLIGVSAFAQKITYVKKEVTLAQLFKEIKKQTGFNVIWNEEKLNAEKSISVNFHGASLNEVMSKALTNPSLSFTITDKTIVITQKEVSFLDRIMSPFREINVSGVVRDENNKPLWAATIKVKNKNKYVHTDSLGRFTLEGVRPDAALVVSYLGYQSREIRAQTDVGTLKLMMISGNLDEVQIVSTGYQTLPKERATGSFVRIDKDLLDRSVSTGILDRLDGVTSGLIFTSPVTRQVGQSAIEIHGRSTLFGNADPLIVLDNFPYDGDINNINPNDIETITILKDAAAASAWGTRSGNGVIVITTKKGSLNTAPKIGFNANVTFGQKPNLYYNSQPSSSEVIDAQQYLYKQGAYDYNIGSGYLPLPPAVELFRNPSAPDYESKLNVLRNNDVRDQLSKYFYQTSIAQQYQANISGGGKHQKYALSAGYDHNLGSAVGNSYNRITLNASNSFYFFKDKLEISSNLRYTDIKNKTIPAPGVSYPYDQLADNNGNSTAVVKDFNLPYAKTAGNGKLLNWLYRPLEELQNRYNTTTTDVGNYRINLALNYKVVTGLKLSAVYNYEKGKSDQGTLYEQASYYTRNLINTYSQIDAMTGKLTRNIPLGDIYGSQFTNSKSQSGRLQIDEEVHFGKHTLNAIAGVEIRELNTNIALNTFYGYDVKTGTNQNSSLNFTDEYPFFYGSGGKIPFYYGSNGTINRFFSYYFNGAYTYADKYIVSLSARQDESNLFGVSTNQKGIPLWSAGLSWVLNKEHFYDIDWLPYLKLRATYGYTGNVDNNLSAYLTSLINPAALNAYNAPFASVINPPNPSLRWEKVRNINFGLDFMTKNSRISGSVDIWQKKGMDLIGNTSVAPQTGMTVYMGNSANTLTKGMDLQINTRNLMGAIQWNTTLLYNHVNSTVTSYKVSNGSNFNVIDENYKNPLEGFPFYSVFSFKYGGLNKNGDPQGYLNGVLSTNYADIYGSTNRKELVYNGSATPTSFGNLLNTFSYKGVGLSFNISYRFGYYFRRNSFTGNSINSGAYSYGDYGSRWQKHGDENYTTVPALIYPFVDKRDDFYKYSDVLVEKADNIRLKDIRLDYTFPQKSGFPVKNLNVFTYIDNVGILWRSNRYHLDPDYPTGVPTVRTIAFGLRAGL